MSSTDKTVPLYFEEGARVDADDEEFCSWECEHFERCHGIRGSAARAMFDKLEPRTDECCNGERMARELNSLAIIGALHMPQEIPSQAEITWTSSVEVVEDDD